VDAPPLPATATDEPAGVTPSPTIRPTPTPSGSTDAGALGGLLASGGDLSVWIAGGIALLASALLAAGIFRRLLN
jgi:hypothetical protein